MRANGRDLRLAADTRPVRGEGRDGHALHGGGRTRRSGGYAGSNFFFITFEPRVE